MLLGSRGSRIRCLVVWTAASAGLGSVVVVARIGVACAATRGGLRETPVDVAIAEVATVALLGCALWMWLATTAVVAEVLRGREWTEPVVRGVPGVPAGVRRVVLAACGVALVGGLAQPSYAHPAHGHRSLLNGLPLPDRAVAAAHHAQPTVVVRPGDTLWSLTAADLPPGSPDRRIARRWHEVYAANRSLIGPDPDVIVPGQRLRLPGEDPP